MNSRIDMMTKRDDCDHCVVIPLPLVQRWSLQFTGFRIPMVHNGHTVLR